MLPERYAMTGEFQALAACQRMGLSPFPDWRGFDAATPGQKRLLLAFNTCMEAIEARERPCL